MVQEPCPVCRQRLKPEVLAVTVGEKEYSPAFGNERGGCLCFYGRPEAEPQGGEELIRGAHYKGNAHEARISY